MKDTDRWVVIAGGGTAGHVLPAVALGRELLRRGLDTDRVLFVGSSRGLEARLVPEAGFPVMLLPGRGIERKVSMQNVRSVIGLVRATVTSWREMRRNRPAVVASVGGYASSPAVVAAAVLRVPIVVVEQNARAGAANRLAARFARASATAFEGTGLPRARLTGNPVRPELLALAHEDVDQRRRNAREQLGIANDVQVLVVFGGSLGARRINDATIELVRLWSHKSSLFVYHISGDRDHDEVEKQVQELDLGPTDPAHIGYRLVRYEDRMDLVYSAADLCLCRAGASSIADLAIMGLPAVLVPLPSAAEDHQTLNAKGVVDAGGAIMIADRELTGDRLVSVMTGIIGDAAKLERMKDGQLSRSHPDAAKAIVDLLVEHASRPLPA